MHRIPVGVEESDSDSCGEPSDSGEEWDNIEVSDWSHCPAPPHVKVPTWAEAHAETRRRVIIDTWEEVIGSSPQRKQPEKEDLDLDEDNCEPMESQSEDPTVVENPTMVEGTHMDTT